MASGMSTFLLLLLCGALFCSSACSTSFRRIGEHETGGGKCSEYEMNFEPIQAEPILESDGGRILQWRSSMMTRMGLMDARMVTVNQGSLLLPQYANAHRVLVLLSGKACMGLMLPFGTEANIRNIYKGEVIAVPRGMPLWIQNVGNQELTFLTFANIRDPMMHGCHKYEAFHLAGAQTKHGMGGILHGFSRDTLTEAMDLDERTVSQLVENQDEVAIVRLGEAHGRRMTISERDLGAEKAGWMADFSYRFESAHRDIVQSRAGQLIIANSYKLPVLKYMDMSIGCLHLKNDALTAPGWFTNADQLIYCVQGSARVQMVRPTGEMAGDVEMNEGDMVMVPKNYPVMMQAGRNGFNATFVMNNDKPIAMHITGGDSVFKAMHPRVRMGAFKISEAVDRHAYEQSTRAKTTFLLPPRKATRRESESEVEEGGNIGGVGMDEIQEALWSMF
ncbi:hypothetical protein KP509_05G087500 [Ceratopteris richardii]|uniref:Cupin type-1 domain-containing protein n=2 Tax=Ceratopteris richardii TaxID=49495 RepID=A0A8T2UW01_CERRI|nr:hypothetical protein KP509_05G087500 [Ceratopteris richardii]